VVRRNRKEKGGIGNGGRVREGAEGRKG